MQTPTPEMIEAVNNAQRAYYAMQQAAAVWKLARLELWPHLAEFTDTPEEDLEPGIFRNGDHNLVIERKARRGLDIRFEPILRIG